MLTGLDNCLKVQQLQVIVLISVSAISSLETERQVEISDSNTRHHLHQESAA